MISYQEKVIFGKREKEGEKVGWQAVKLVRMILVCSHKLFRYYYEGVTLKERSGIGLRDNRHANNPLDPFQSMATRDRRQ